MSHGPVTSASPSEDLLKRTFAIWNGSGDNSTTWDDLDEGDKRRWRQVITEAMAAQTSRSTPDLHLWTDEEVQRLKDKGLIIESHTLPDTESSDDDIPF